jgi:LPS-assembly protein
MRATGSEPVEISNSGIISVDQASETVVIEGDVTVSQSPLLLTTDEITWNRATDFLLARGNVRLFLDLAKTDNPDLIEWLGTGTASENESIQEILKSDALKINLSTQEIEPEGFAQLQLGMARILGREFKVDMDAQEASSGDFRLGFNQLFFEGEGVEIQGDSLIAQDARFYIGEPEALSIQGTASSIEKVGDEAVILKGIKLKIGTVPVFYWPYYRHGLGRQIFSVTGGAGYSGDLGTYVETRTYYRPNGYTEFFSDINGYTQRGILAGPGFKIDTDSETGPDFFAKLETGFIDDSGDLGEDILGEAITDARNWIDFELVYSNGGSFQALGQLQRWSDSEVLRDFYTGRFRSIQQPESFLEMSWSRRNLAASVKLQYRNQDFEFVTERLPEISVQWLPSQVFASGIYHSAYLGAAKLRNSDPDIISELENTRYRGYYHVIYPIRLSKWLDFIPQGTIQSLIYKNKFGNREAFDITQSEIGFDLNMHAFAQWQLENRVWDIDGIRHTLKPTLQLRYIDVSGQPNDDWDPIDTEVFTTGIQDLDLTAYPALDDLDARTIARFGVDNSLHVRSLADGQIRKLAGIGLFHDFYHYHDGSRPDRSFVAANLDIQPAYWIRLNVQSRFDTRDIGLNDLFGQLSLMDGDIWDIDIGTQFIEQRLQQYLLNFRYKLTEDLRFISSVGYDAERSIFYEQTYGLQFSLANYWDLYVSINTRSGSTRNDNTRFEIRIRPARF